MPVGDYALGLILFAVVAAASGGSAFLVTRRLLGNLVGAARVVAAALLTTAALLVAHLVPGALGLLSSWTPAVSAVLLAFGASRLPRGAARPEPRRPAPGESTVSVAAAAAAVGAVAIAAVAGAWTQSAVPATFNVDTLTFHLPNIARWIQTGSFWQVDQFVPLLAQGNYPQNGDVVFLSVVLPWDNDAFARMVNWPFYALMGAGVYAIARELGAPRGASGLFGAVFLAVPVVARTASAGTMTDTILLATLAAGTLFLLRHVRTGLRSDLVLAGLGLGIAFGTKWYGPPAVATVLGVWLVASLLCGRRPAEVVRRGAVAVGATLAAGGFWLVRNLVESGNPVFPQKVELGGVTLFNAPRDVIRERYDHTVGDYLFDWGVLRDAVLPQLRDFLALPGLLLALGIVLALGAAWGAIRGEDELRRPFALACAAALLVAVYLFTPYSALGLEGRPTLAGENSRYALPALLLGAAGAAWGCARLGRVRPAVDALALAAVAIGLSGGYYLAASTVVLAAALVAVVSGAGYGVLRWSRAVPAERGRAIRLAAAGAALLALACVGYARQRTFNDGRYAGVDPAIDWVARNAPSGHRIGLAGRWDEGVSPVLPMFGPRLENEVAYVGEWRDGLLQEHRSGRAFAAAVRNGRFDLLMVGRGRPPTGITRTERWARANGYRVVARSRRLALYRVASASGRAARR